MMKYLPLLMLLFLLPAPAPPEAHWIDSRHIVLTWTQKEAAEVCVFRLAHQNSILIGCDHVEAGEQAVTLPIDGPHDAETEPREGDVYEVKALNAAVGAHTAALGPRPEYDVWLPAVWR